MQMFPIPSPSIIKVLFSSLPAHFASTHLRIQSSSHPDSHLFSSLLPTATSIYCPLKIPPSIYWSSFANPLRIHASSHPISSHYSPLLPLFIAHWKYRPLFIEVPFFAYPLHIHASSHPDPHLFSLLPTVTSIYSPLKIMPSINGSSLLCLPTLHPRIAHPVIQTPISSHYSPPLTTLLLPNHHRYLNYIIPHWKYHPLIREVLVLLDTWPYFPLVTSHQTA